MPLSVQKLVNRLTFRQLQVFLCVYQLKSYSKAGEQLGLTQPAVSSQIRQLESALGVPVFEYVRRQLYCTAAGEKLATSIQVMFDELRYLQNDLAELQGKVAGDLDLVAVNTAQYVVPYLLKGFLAEFPQVKINLKVVNRSEAIEKLNKNQGHLVIMGIVPEDNTLSSLPFMDNEFVPVAPPDNPINDKDKLTLKRFLEEGLLLREPGSGSRLALEVYCQQNRLSLNPKLELGSNETIKHAVLAGIGVAVLPKLSIQSELKLGLIKEVAIPNFQLKRSWCVVHNKSKHPTPAMNAFLQFVMENMGQFGELTKLGTMKENTASETDNMSQHP